MLNESNFAVEKLSSPITPNLTKKYLFLLDYTIFTFVDFIWKFDTIVT